MLLQREAIVIAVSRQARQVRTMFRSDSLLPCECIISICRRISYGRRMTGLRSSMIGTLLIMHQESLQKVLQRAKELWIALKISCTRSKYLSAQPTELGENIYTSGGKGTIYSRRGMMPQQGSIPALVYLNERKQSLREDARDRCTARWLDGLEIAVNTP